MFIENFMVVFSHYVYYVIYKKRSYIKLYLLLLLVRLHDQSSSSDEVGGLLQVLQAFITRLNYMNEN